MSKSVGSGPAASSSDSTQEMLEVLISLMGRLTFPPATLKSIITKRKKNPTDYIRAYNLCDGKHIVTEIAEAINVKQPTLTPILQEWKDQGIVYESVRKGGKFYKKLYKLDVPKTGKNNVADQGDSESLNDSGVQAQLLQPEVVTESGGQ